MAFRKGTQGMMQVDYEQRINFDRMREYRVDRIKHYMDKFDIECLLLFDTGNKRYSTSTAVCSPEIDNMGRHNQPTPGTESLYKCCNHCFHLHE